MMQLFVMKFSRVAAPLRAWGKTASEAETRMRSALCMQCGLSAADVGPLESIEALKEEQNVF